jgi:hypothetical protein
MAARCMSFCNNVWCQIHCQSMYDHNLVSWRQNKKLVSSHPTDPKFNPRSYNFFFHFHNKQKNASTGKKQTTITSYPRTMGVTDIFHDMHLPVDKTSIVTMLVLLWQQEDRQLCQDQLCQKKKKNPSYLFFCHVIGNHQFIIFFPNNCSQTSFQHLYPFVACFP